MWAGVEELAELPDLVLEELAERLDEA